MLVFLEESGDKRGVEILERLTTLGQTKKSDTI